MRPAHFFVFFLAVGLANAQLGGLIGGVISGVIEGGMKGMAGGFYPVMKDAMGTVGKLFFAEMSAGMDFAKELSVKAPELMRSVAGVVTTVMKQNMNVIKNLGGMAEIAFKQLGSMLGGGASAAAATFGGMNGKDQQAVVHIAGNMNRALASVTHAKANALKDAHTELPALQKVMESAHRNPKILFAQLKAKSPKLSEFVGAAYQRVLKEFHAGQAKLEPSAKAGLHMIQESLRLSQRGIEKILFAMGAKEQKQFGPLFHLMTNTLHVANAAF